VIDDTEQLARLREPVGYWNALALLCVIGLACALGLATDATRALGERLAALGAMWLLGVVVALTYSRGGALSLAVAVALIAWFARAPLRTLGLTALAAITAAPGAAFAYSSHALTTDGAPLDDRIADGRILALILVLSLGSLLAAGRVALTFERPEWRRRAWRALAALALLGVVALFATGTVGRGIDSFGDTKEAPPVDDPARLLSASSGNRLVWWEEAFGAWADAPIAGHGAGSFPVLHLQYRDNLLPVKQPHDVPLEFAAETGVIGLALGVGAILALLIAAGGRARAEDGLAAALLGAGAAWSVHTLVDWDWDIPAVTVPALLALGVAAARPPSEPARPRPGLLAALAVGLVLYGLSLSLPAFSRAKADEALRRAGADASPAQLEAAAHEAELATRLNPLAVEPLFAAAAIAQRRDRLLEQRRLLLDAVDRQPSSAGAWARLVVVAMALNDRAGAIAAANRALELDPHNRDLREFALDAQSFSALPNDSPTATGTPLPLATGQNAAP
jgi:O-antigen ligase